MRLLILTLPAILLSLPIPAHGTRAAESPSKAQQEAPTRPAKPKADTPLAAMRGMVLDYDADDPKLLRRWLWTSSELESEGADVWAGSMTGQSRLQREVFKRYGLEGLRRLSPGSKDAQPPRTDRAKAEAEVDALLKEAVITADGDKASIAHAKQPGKAVELRRTDDGWRIVFTSVLGEKKPEQIKYYIRLNKRWGPGFHATAEGVAAGKFESVDEVNVALRELVDQPLDEGP